jgi:hypothetical protein
MNLAEEIKKRRAAELSQEEIGRLVIEMADYVERMFYSTTDDQIYFGFDHPSLKRWYYPSTGDIRESVKEIVKWFFDVNGFTVEPHTSGSSSFPLKGYIVSLP